MKEGKKEERKGVWREGRNERKIAFSSSPQRLHGGEKCALLEAQNLLQLSSNRRGMIILKRMGYNVGEAARRAALHGGVWSCAVPCSASIVPSLTWDPRFRNHEADVPRCFPAFHTCVQ